MIEDNGPMRKVVERVCKSFTTGTDYLVFEVVPRTVGQDLKEALQQKTQLRDLIAQSKQTFYNYMSEFTLKDYSLIPVYKQFVAREKTIYRALNMAKEAATFSIGLVWVPLYRQQEFLSHVTKMQDSGLNIHVKVRKQD